MWEQNKRTIKKYKQIADITQCSVTCGPGYKTRSAICVQNNKMVNPSECDAQKKPQDMRIICSNDPCWRKVFEDVTKPLNVLLLFSKFLELLVLAVIYVIREVKIAFELIWYI